jgi:hypothetical protein
MPDNESSAKIDMAGITEAIRQCVKDLDAEVERINAAREAMPPPIDRAATSIQLKPHRRASPTERPSDEQRSRRRQKPAAPADD